MRGGIRHDTKRRVHRCAVAARHITGRSHASRCLQNIPCALRTASHGTHIVSARPAGCSWSSLTSMQQHSTQFDSCCPPRAQASFRLTRTEAGSRAALRAEAATGGSAVAVSAPAGARVRETARLRLFVVGARSRGTEPPRQATRAAARRRARDRARASRVVRLCCMGRPARACAHVKQCHG